MAQRTLKFGGRATAVGVGYEAQVAATIAVKMLGGDRCVVWDGIHGGEIAAITMQDSEPVDDVVVTLTGDSSAKIFISAKHRIGTIALTPKSAPFTEVVDSFVQQFLQLTPEARDKCRLMWAVPSSAGVAMTQDLLRVLNTFREDDSQSLASFLKRRSTRESKAMTSLIAQIKVAWKSLTKKAVKELDLKALLRMVHVGIFDFGVDLRHERQAEETIRSLIASETKQARRIWDKLVGHLAHANQRGLRTTSTSFRQILAKDGLKLKAKPSFADDVETLKRLTVRNIERLKDHTSLRFANADIHIERGQELSAMATVAKSAHLLVTGEPGCGKSGLIHPLTETLAGKGIPVVLLLAEEVFTRDWNGVTNLPSLSHALDDVLANWPDGSKGVLITDALDAVRDVETQKMLRSLLRDVQKGVSGWNVVASVREFDLKHGRELREAFPGNGVPGHCSKEFAGVSHFHVTGLAESELDDLVAQVPEIGPFVTSARSNLRGSEIHRSPFFLRLAAELLRDGVSPTRLADWSSPAVLLRKFWQARVQDGDGASQREIAVQAICRKMVDLRSMTLSTQEAGLGVSERDAVVELRSRGILRSPVLKYGMRVGDDELHFTHHLLHDYAIARSLIPITSSRFADFAVREPMLPIFYRQSFMFALEELWDGPEGRAGFWESALKMEGVVQLHGLSRILAPILAARRVDTFEDLEPLLIEVQNATTDDSPAEKALRHMASGLQDADDNAVRAGASAWCLFVSKISLVLFTRPSLETPIVHILARLNTVCGAFDSRQLQDLNSAARGVLMHHVTKDVSKGWRYASHTAIEILCRTFSAAPSESEASLLSLLAPKRLANFPHWDLFDFAHQIKNLGNQGDNLVLRLFEAAFRAEPKSGEWESFGGAIMPLRMQSSDNWNSVQYSLADYYENSTSTDAGLMTEIACIAWNSVVRKRIEKYQDQ